MEGLDAGASDYLVKPFTARELLARVGAHLEMARVRKQAAQREAELRAEAEAARDKVVGVLESIQDGFFTLDRDWRFTYVNAAGEQLLGASREEFAGKEPLGTLSGDRGHAWENANTGAPSATRYRSNLRSSTSPWSAGSPSRLTPPSRAGISVYFRDITEQKRRRRLLRESQDRLRAIYDGTYEYIGLLAPDGTLLEANRASLEFADNTREDVVGRPFWDTPWFTATPGAPEPVRESMARAARASLSVSKLPCAGPPASVRLSISLSIRFGTNAAKWC